MHNGIKAAIIAGVVAVGVGLASPLFYETQVNEPLPAALSKIEEGLTIEKFSNMDDERRQVMVEKMPQKTRDMIMDESATITKTVSESMQMSKDSPESSIAILKSGQFAGLVGHHAEGIAKIIQTNDEAFLRFEDFQVTNGPDLRVYLTHGGDIKEGTQLAKLKGSKGDQNYSLQGINFENYDTVVIYCQPFGVYFGQAKLQ